MMRVYLSGPITGTSDYLERFEAAEQKVLETFGGKVEIINPAKIGQHLPASFTHEEYMLFSYLEIDFCDAVAMLPGWRNSAGACMENGYARGKDKLILEV